MPSRRPPSAVSRSVARFLALGIALPLAGLIACAYASGETAPEAGDVAVVSAGSEAEASRGDGSGAPTVLASRPPAVSSPPPAAVAALPDPFAQPPPPAPRPSELTARELAHLVLAARARGLTKEQRAGVAKVLAHAEQELDLEVLLLLALMAQESSFNPRAVGPRGSLGLMQIRPWVGADIAMRYGLDWSGDEALYDPAFNVRLGTYYFAEMMEMFGQDPLLALAAYNMGPYRVRRLLREGYDPRPEYVDKVFHHYDALYDRFYAAGVGWGG